jgi:hypothetical protein
MAKPTDPNTADVAKAISRYLGVDANRPEVAAIASRISLHGIRLEPGGDIAQNPEFRSRLIAAGGNDLAALIDPSRQAQLAREQQERANVTGAGNVAVGWDAGAGKLHGLPGGPERGTANDSGTSATAKSSLKYNESAAYDVAIRTPGLEWAARNPELLRLGPAAMHTLAEMKFREDSYRALTRDAGAKPAEVLAFVEAAKARGMSPEETNNAAKIVGETSKGLPHEEQRKNWEAFQKWMQAKSDAERQARRQESDAVLDGIAAAHPDKKEAVERQRQMMRELDQKKTKELKTSADKAAERASTVNRETVAAAQENKAAENAARANDLFGGSGKTKEASAPAQPSTPSASNAATPSTGQSPGGPGTPATPAPSKTAAKPSGHTPG